MTIKQHRREAHIAGSWGLLPIAKWAYHLGSGSSSLRQAFRWLQPMPTSQLQPHERLWAKTTWLSHSGPIHPLDTVDTLPRAHNTFRNHKDILISVKIRKKKFEVKKCFNIHLYINTIIKYNFYIILRRKGPKKAKVPTSYKSHNVVLKLLLNSWPMVSLR